MGFSNAKVGPSKIEQNKKKFNFSEFLNKNVFHVIKLRKSEKNHRNEKI